MKLTTLIAALAVAMALTPSATRSAQAREHYHRHHVGSTPRYFDVAPAAGAAWGGSSAARADAAFRQSEAHAGLGARPHAWCGWEMRQLVGADPGPAFNLARNWARWGHAGPPGIGAVVVWSHHVGKIVGQENGQWLIQSGNDGNRVRTRPLSIAHAIAIRWG